MVYTNPYGMNSFIHSTRDKLWLVWDNQILEMQNYALQASKWTFRNEIEPIYRWGERDAVNFVRRPVPFEASFDLISPSVSQFELGMDLDDFYELKDLKHMSDLITRKLMGLGK